MPCDTRIRNAQQAKLRAEAKQKLEEEIAAGQRRIEMNPVTGEVGITDFEQTEAYKQGWCDGCIIRAMQETCTDWEVQSQLAAAGVQAGQSFVSVGHNGHGH